MIGKKIYHCWVAFRFLIGSSIVALLIFSCAPPKSIKTPVPKKGYPRPYRVGSKWYQPLPYAKDFVQRGIASWYGKDFHGKKAANGEIYNMHAFTAAHKTLPFETYVKVRNLKNNREVEVRINDRGPFVRGRIIDLSFSAAKKIALVGPGTAPVEIVALGAAARPQYASNGRRTYIAVDYFSGNFTVQIGAFADRKNAVRLRKKLDRSYKHAHITDYDTGSKRLYRVRVGKCKTLSKAAEYERYLIKKGFTGAFVVAE